jgi:hypothetical protein
VYKNKHITKYHDVWRHQYFKRYKKHIHITKIQPILHIHKVTRIHTKRIGVIVPVRVRLTQRLPDRVFVTHSTIHLKPVCGCSSGHGHGGYGRY